MNTRGVALAAAFLLLSARAPDGGAATYHVRVDGGDAVQCDGSTDAAYPGSGTTLRCAWKHPFMALPPGGSARLAGGDTLVVHPGDYRMGFGAPGADGCDATRPDACTMPPLPSGPSATRPTRLLGTADGRCDVRPVLWGTGGARSLLDLTGTAHAEIACLELTDHDPCITGYPADAAKGMRCGGGSTADWAVNGIVATDSSDVTLRDLDIHGLAGNGVRAGRLRDWTLAGVRLHANGWAGWDGNVSGKSNPDSSNAGTIRFSDGEISWNGCGERFPDHAIVGCWAQQAGGYGDGLGTAATGGDWVFEDMRVHHNTSDGLDLLYLDGGGSVVLRRIHAYGNAGNQVKTAGTMILEDSILEGDCAFFAALGRADPAKSILSGKDHCRALGNTLSITFKGGSRALVRNNTLSGQGDCLVVTTGGDAAASGTFRNNLLVGGEQWGTDGEATCGQYTIDGSASLSFERNLFWKLKARDCPPGNLCGEDPRVPGAGTDAHRWTPPAGSPAVDAGSPDGATGSDFFGHPRTSIPDIGAIESR